MNKDLSPSVVLKKAWEVFKPQMNILGSLWAVVAVVNILFSILDNPRDGRSILVSVISYVFGVVSIYVVTRSSIMAVRGEKVTKDSILTFDWPTIGWLAVGSIIYGFMVGIGTVLLIVPGIIIAVKFFPISYAIIDEKLDAIAGLKRANELTKGHGWDLFLMIVILIVGSIILTIVTMGIAGLVIMPINVLIGAVLYEILRNYSIPEKKESETPVVAK